jgi:hypothetical protein
MEPLESDDWDAIEAIVTNGEAALDRLRAARDCIDLAVIGDAFLRIRQARRLRERSRGMIGTRHAA